MRHDYVTLARLAGMPDMVIQQLAGHKDARMMAQYSHANQIIDFQAVNKTLEIAFLAKAVGGKK
jgi:integrase